MPLSTHRHHVLAALAAGLLVVAGCTAEEPDGADEPTTTETTSTPTPTPTGTATTTPQATTPASPGDEATGDETVAAMTFTECEAERYTVAHPQDWHTNDPGLADACEVFHPGEVDLPEQPQDRDLHWAVSLQVDAVAWEDVQPESGPDEVIESRETTVDGRRAVVVEQRSTGEALLPEGERRYSYRVDLDGETLIASTHTVGDTDYERDRAVLDRMMDELVLGDGSAQDDAEEVVSHDTGDRSFGVYARSIADGVCLEVRTDQGTDEDCGPVEGDLDVRILTVGDQDHVTGIVGGGPIVDIDMLANDGSAIADEFATAELVEILGESGYRAFAPADGPASYSAVVGYGPDGEEIARAEL